MDLWLEGNFDALVRECRTIQSKLPSYSNNFSSGDLTKKFANLVLEGKINAAMRLLDANNASGLLSLSDKVIDELKMKHPPSAPADPSTLMAGEIPFIDPVMFENFDETIITKAALHTKGAAGLSGMNADGWRRILVSKNFGKTGEELKTALAKFTRILCTRDINKGSIEAFVSCRLVPLDKNPGVRPIGIGEVLRRIIGKSIIRVIKPDILESGGSLQLCTGLPSGCEAAVHAMKDIFEEEETDGLLLVDASNAFNSLNREALLHNIKYICPPMAQYVNNCYGKPSRLFITGGKEIPSAEGTTQGDPFAMPVYAIGVLPLLSLIKSAESKVKHAAYADDLGGAGTLLHLKSWWENVLHYDPLIGYHPNASKSWLVVKEENYEQACKIFGNTQINITTSGRKYLGSYIGTANDKSEYANKVVNGWIEELKVQCRMARSEPHAAYTCFVSGFRHRITYLTRVIPDFCKALKLLDAYINEQFLPVLTEGYHCSEIERKLISLPVRLGGLGIPIFSEIAHQEYAFSKRVTSQLSMNIKQQATELRLNNNEMKKTKIEIAHERTKSHEEKLALLRESMTLDQRKANELSCMKGASSWLTSLPLKAENCVLNKREFHDAIRSQW